MTAHVHLWIPIPLAAGSYQCECGVTGRRGKIGVIVEKKLSRANTQWSARPVADCTGWVDKKPGAE